MEDEHADRGGRPGVTVVEFEMKQGYRLTFYAFKKSLLYSVKED